MTHKSKPKRSALKQQIADEASRRAAVEAERDEWMHREEVADLDRRALAESSDAFARNVLRAAGVNGTGSLEKVRRLARVWLDG